MPKVRAASAAATATSAPPVAGSPDRPAYQKFAVAVRPSTIDGQGVFALEAVPRWKKIGEVRGESISVDEARRRAATLARIMIVEITDKKAVDLAASADPMRYTNHSCQPNGQLRIQAGRIEFYALRDIAPGEEITVNYGESHHEGRLTCRCGATGCAGRL
jgi:SET domain-containing protein